MDGLFGGVVMEFWLRIGSDMMSRVAGNIDAFAGWREEDDQLLLAGHWRMMPSLGEMVMLGRCLPSGAHNEFPNRGGNGEPMPLCS